VCLRAFWALLPGKIKRSRKARLEGRTFAPFHLLIEGPSTYEQHSRLKKYGGLRTLWAHLPDNVLIQHGPALHRNTPHADHAHAALSMLLTRSDSYKPLLHECAHPVHLKCSTVLSVPTPACSPETLENQRNASPFPHSGHD
jgi:hypothetical protein